ncbi:uncharacterized protein LOC135686376 isoform X2 [Rhopilema esculentum]|uniref:uncharacterized protein LOC135686376 isoform X2 n=1 Tax=Rhopilema esculentum TaxID=499914 RepID=UPI0031DF7D28
MAYTSAGYFSGPPPYNHYNHQLGDTGVFVVNQQPQSRRQFQFPISFPPRPVLVVSIAQCIIGSLYFIFGIVNIIVIPYFTSYIAFPVWCGLVILANGIVGCCVLKMKSKCLFGAFCGLSITSLILTVVMVIFYSISLDYFDNSSFLGLSCNSYGYCYNFRTLSKSIKEASIGLLGLLVALILIELGCSIAAVVYSCKAYSKCCTTCLGEDCCACVGCCECDASPLTPHQPLRQQGGQNLQLQNQFGYGQYPQTQQQPLFQQLNAMGVKQGDNPCSVLLNVIINMPGSSYLVDTARSGQNDSQVQTMSSTIHPRDGMQPSGSSQHTAEEGQAVNPSA